MQPTVRVGRGHVYVLRRNNQQCLGGKVRQRVDFVAPADAHGAATEQEERHIGPEASGNLQKSQRADSFPRKLQEAQQRCGRIAGPAAESAPGGNLLLQQNLHAQPDVQLPPPQMDGGRPLMQVLKDRKSTREFRPDKLPMQTLSNLLWAGFGINRPDGRRTAPSASNKQEIDIYVATADALYVYDAKTNRLHVLLREDLRVKTGTQPFVGEAPMNLIYVADLAKTGTDSEERDMDVGADTGVIAENVYLFCASEGLSTVVRGSIDRVTLSKAMTLRANQRIVLAQTVGYPPK